MFEKTKNIDTAFRAVKMFSILIILFCFCICSYVLYKSYTLSENSQNKIFVLAGDKVIEAYASSRKDNVAVEARDHVRMFHTYFFSLDPDEKTIESNISRALYLGDASAKKQYDNLKETGYYSGIISGNISQQIFIDSVQVDIHREPYLFRCFGIIKITRPTSTVTRSLITQGYLRNVSRSDHNAHGFLIERWETIENKDLKTEIR